VIALLALALALQELPPQRLEAGACALVLWEPARRQRVAMVTRTGDDIVLRLMIDGVEMRLAGESAAGAAVLGFAPEAGFAAPGLVASHRLELVAGPGGRGAAVRGGVLSVRKTDDEELVLPVAGLIGCG
jgi:hypothetical protein